MSSWTSPPAEPSWVRRALTAAQWRWSRLGPLGSDAVLAAVVFLLSAALLGVGPSATSAPLPVTLLVLAGLSALLLLRRTWPLLVVLVMLATDAATTIVPALQDADNRMLAAPFAFYALGAYAGTPAIVLGGMLVAGETLWSERGQPLPQRVPGVVAVAAVIATGLLVRRRRQRAAARAARDLALAVQRERERIAAELHTAIAHTVAGIVLGAGAGSREEDPQRTRQALLEARIAGSEALAALRRLLGILRDPDQPVAGPPAPPVDFSVSPAELAGDVLKSSALALWLIIAVGTLEFGPLGPLCYIAASCLGVWLWQLRRRRQAELALVPLVEQELAVVAERARLARELHDEVAHHLAGVVLTAGAALHAGHLEGPQAAAALDVVRTGGSRTLDAIRRLVGVLESGDDLPQTPAERGHGAPFGLSGLDALVAENATLGLPVLLHVQGKLRPLPPEVDLSAYRIVQEGLTNVRKHGGCPASVTIECEGEQVIVRVTDPGPVGPPRQRPPGGHGLRGVNERVRMLGGWFRAGPRGDGGWELEAHLPLAPPAVVPGHQH